MIRRRPAESDTSLNPSAALTSTSPLRRRSDAQAWRLPILALVVLVGVGGVAYDHFRPGQTSVTELSRRIQMAATATPVTSTGSAWFCPMVADSATGPGSITIAAPGANGPVTGTVTLHGPSGTVSQQSVSLDGMAPLVVAVSGIPGINPDSVPTLGAVVELDVGGAVVEARLPGNGNPAAPCSSSASSRWWFPDGSTVVGSSTDLVLFNPFPEDALVDLRFVTESGIARPGALQGLAIPGGSVRTIPLQRYVRRRAQLSTAVSARSGRVVAAERYTVGAVGSALIIGAPEASRTWFFPSGGSSSASSVGLDERYELLNPGIRDAVVDMAFLLDQGDTEPFTVTVPKGGRLTFEPGKETRLPKGVTYSVAMLVSEGSPVVVQRTVRATAPFRRRGLASLLGSPRTATRWVLAEGGASGALDETVSVLNPFDQPASVSVTALSPSAVQGLPWPKITLAAGARVELRVGDHLRADHAALVVTSTEVGIVVQRDMVSTAGPSAPPSVSPAPSSAAGRGFAVVIQTPVTSRVPASRSTTSTLVSVRLLTPTSSTVIAPPPTPTSTSTTPGPPPAATTAPSTSTPTSIPTLVPTASSTSTAVPTSAVSTSTTVTLPASTTSTAVPGPQVAVPVNNRPRLGWSSSMAAVAE